MKSYPHAQIKIHIAAQSFIPSAITKHLSLNPGQTEGINIGHLCLGIKSG